MADVIAEIATHLPAHLPHVVRLWFIVDATVDTHLLLRIAKTTTPQSHGDERRRPSTATLESPSQPSPLRPTSHPETRIPQAPIRKW